MMSFSWGMMLFGTRQCENLLLADADRASAAFDAVAAAGRSGLGPGLGTVADSAERLFGLVTSAPGDPGDLALALAERSADLYRMLPGQDHAGTELANKIQAFRDFQNAESRPGVAPAPDSTLASRAEHAAALGAYHGLWTVEGLGCAHSERAWRQGEPPAGLLHGDLPSSALIPLHTGMGVALAVASLRRVDARRGDAPLAAAVQHFIDLCGTNAAPGFEPMAFEALGLAVRQLHPHLLGRVDRVLAAIDRELVDYYWHGVGRALYFTPTDALPTASLIFEKAWREPPHAAGRRNALSGAAWALTLVNVRHPAVLEDSLRRFAGRIFDDAAFANGAASALLVWYASNGRDTFLRALIDHRPAPAAASLWRRLVSEPAEEALLAFHNLEKSRLLATIFRCPPAAGRAASSTASAGGAMYRILDGWLSRAIHTLSQGGKAARGPEEMERHG